MTSPRPIRNRERILEAIDQLRKRKARPDIPRICAYLFRRFHVPSAEAKADLEWCVENNIVLKVEYKGNISYRNAAKKWAQMKRREQQHANSNTIIRQASSQNFMELLTHVFGELVVEEPDYLESGVPPKEIVDNILQKDSATYTKSYIAILLVNEVERGNLVKLSNGHYLLGPCSEDTRKPDVAEKLTSNFSQSPHRRTLSTDGVKVDNSYRKREEEKVAIVKPKKQLIAKLQAEKRREKELLDSRSREGKRQDPGNLRFGGRRKKAKKVFDPSDNHIPKKRGRPAGSLNKTTIEKQQSFKTKDDDSRPESRTSTGSRDHSGVCSVCHTHSKKSNDRMVPCRECSNKAHYGCLNGEDMMLKMYPDNTWQCPHCKTCVVCYETSDAGNLIVCSVCADGYHATCHQPRVMDKIKNGQRWLCVNCRVSDKMMFNVIESNIGDVRHRITISDDNDKDSPSKANSLLSGRSSPYYSSSSSPEADSNLKSDGEADAQSDSGKESDEESNIDPSIPDATLWTPDEVYQYFAQFFPEEAKVFKEQEIDGRSLLLLKRLDVLTGLKLKLGPALKIYRHVTMLQARRDDRRLYWL